MKPYIYCKIQKDNVYTKWKQGLNIAKAKRHNANTCQEQAHYTKRNKTKRLNFKKHLSPDNHKRLTRQTFVQHDIFFTKKNT